MQPQDLNYLVVMIIALGMIMFGAMVPSISFLLWAGIVLAVAAGVAWVTSIVKRHGTQF